MSALSSNAEFVRHIRLHLRLKRVLAYAFISLFLSFIVGFFYIRQGDFEGRGQQSSGSGMLFLAFVVQALILAGGGGIACLNSIYSEKDRNTFDYQRVTRLTSLELALGKLFGAPLLMYLICVCLAPITFYAAILAGGDVSHVLAAYAVLLIASIAFHSFNLLLSLVLVRGSQVSGIILSLFLLYFMSVGSFGAYFYLHPLGPFMAPELANSHSWAAPRPTYPGSAWRYGPARFTDLFWGRPVHHFPVLIVLDLLLTAWFLLAVIRNIKKDPEQYELYSPLQFLGLAIFLNLVIVSFYNTAWATPLDTQAIFLTFNIVILSLLGIALLRSRERMRSLLRADPSVSSWAATLWPAPILGLAALFAGGLISGCLYYSHSSSGEWNFGFALLRALFFTVWIARDIQFLQVMNLRPGKHPLVLACIFLFLYYICALFLLGALGCLRIPGRIPFTSLFLPTPVFVLDFKAWSQAPSVWICGFAVHLVLLGFFVYLQRDRVRSLQASPAVAAVANS